MLLSARMLVDVGGVNSWEYSQAVEFSEGDAPQVHFQLIDSSLDRHLVPKGRRYMPASGATLEVTLDNLDDEKKVVRSATQPFSQDPSIWRIQLLTTDKVRGTTTMRLKLTEGTTVRRGSLPAAILVASAKG